MSDHERLRRLGDVSPLRNALHEVDPAMYWPDEQPGEVRVVLIKRSDQLLIGNVGELTEESCEGIQDTFRRLGFDRPVILFEHDIDMDVYRDEQNMEARP